MAEFIVSSKPLTMIVVFGIMWFPFWLIMFGCLFLSIREWWRARRIPNV